MLYTTPASSYNTDYIGIYVKCQAGLLTLKCKIASSIYVKGNKEEIANIGRLLIVVYILIPVYKGLFKNESPD